MGKKRVLIVDDELTIIKLLRANLEANGYETFVAMDGAEALQKVERELPDSNLGYNDAQNRRF